MIPIKDTFIDIHPATNVRSTRNETWLLAEKVTYEYLREQDDKKFDREVAEGKENPKRGTLESRKKQLEINKAHKDEIKAWVVRNEFKMPLGYFAAWFYVPMPPSWRKKRIAEMIYTVHQNTPDLDNYLKQLYDAIMPRKNRQKGEKGMDDRKIFCYSAFKVWVPLEEAGMKIVEYDKDDYMDEFRHGHPKHCGQASDQG